jgi:hypothetical protein
MAFPGLSWCHAFEVNDDYLLLHTSELIMSTTVVTAQLGKKEET